MRDSVEPTDVLTAPQHEPAPTTKKSGSAKLEEQQKQIVNMNSGFMIAFDIKYAIDAIKNNLIGPLRQSK